jgi:2,4-didehydro-3-deoxy-L-rhamnonate hydrolase
MRFGNLSGRLTLFIDGGAVDVAHASGDRFSSDPQAIYEVWDDFVSWAAAPGQVDPGPFDPTDLGAPTPAPAQVFAIGLNNRDHAAESKLDVSDTFPPVFPSSAAHSRVRSPPWRSRRAATWTGRSSSSR